MHWRMLRKAADSRIHVKAPVIELERRHYASHAVVASCGRSRLCWHRNKDPRAAFGIKVKIRHQRKREILKHTIAELYTDRSFDRQKRRRGAIFGLNRAPQTHYFSFTLRVEFDVWIRQAKLRTMPGSGLDSTENIALVIDSCLFDCLEGNDAPLLKIQRLL